MRTVFAGSISYDYLMTFPGHFKDHFLENKIEQISLSFLVDNMTRHRGGVAPNIAYNYALLGGRGTILGAAGAEDFDSYRTWLEQHNIDLSGVKLIDGMATASFFANTDQSNAQIASFYPGAMSRAAECRIADLGFTPDLVVISPDAPDAMMAHIRECRELGIKYVYDPGQQLVRMTSEQVHEGVESAHILIVNDYEWSLIEQNLNLTLKEVLDSGTICVITLGDKGSVIYADDQKFEVSAAHIHQIKDPTGAGDAYRGGFLRGLSVDLDWATCGKLGALNATYCIENIGTQNHRYTLHEYVTRYGTYFENAKALKVLLDL